MNKVICEINKLTGSEAPVVKIPNFDPRFCNLGLILNRGLGLSNEPNTRFGDKAGGDNSEWKCGTAIQLKHSPC